MTLRTKFTLTTVSCLTVVMAVGAWHLRRHQAKVFEEEVRSHSRIVLSFSQACRKYVKQDLRPAVQEQVAELDYAMSFQVSNNRSFELAERVIDLAPDGFTQCFFTNSGSESVDTALKIALGFHRARGAGISG